MTVIGNQTHFRLFIRPVADKKEKLTCSLSNDKLMLFLSPSNSETDLAFEVIKEKAIFK